MVNFLITTFADYWGRVYGRK